MIMGMARQRRPLSAYSASLTLAVVVALLWLPENEAFLSRGTAARPLSALCASDGTSLVDARAAVLQEGLDKMKRVMTADFFESCDSLKSLYSQMKKSVEVKESSIPGAGLGLFARKNIKTNTIISFYPAHALGVEEEEGNGFISNDPEYFETHPSSSSDMLHCTDQPIFQRPSLLQQAGLEDTPLYLDVNPNLPLSDIWVSQMINDGATIQSNTEDGVLDYYKSSKLAKNCIHIPVGPSPIIATVTKRKVKKGQEFLTTYGSTYWLGVLLDIHQGGVGVTPKIQAEIQETAVDLRNSMQRVSIVYANQVEALQVEFEKL